MPTLPHQYFLPAGIVVHIERAAGNQGPTRAGADAAGPCLGQKSWSIDVKMDGAALKKGLY